MTSKQNTNDLHHNSFEALVSIDVNLVVTVHIIPWLAMGSADL